MAWKFEVTAFYLFLLEEKICMQFMVTIMGVLYVDLSGLLNFWSGYMLSDACSNTAIQYATQGWLKEMKNWLS